jgi:hypothetical protein
MRGMSLKTRAVAGPSAYNSTSSNNEISSLQKEDATDETGASIHTIGSLFDGLMICLKTVLYHIQQSSPEPSYYGSLEKSAAALLFWGSDHGVSHGDLDKALRYSGFLRDTVLLVLTSIGDILSQSKPIY